MFRQLLLRSPRVKRSLPIKYVENKKRPKVFYHDAVVPDESPGIPTPTPVITVSRKQLAQTVSALERSFYHSAVCVNFRGWRSHRFLRLRLSPNQDVFPEDGCECLLLLWLSIDND